MKKLIPQKSTKSELFSYLNNELNVAELFIGHVKHICLNSPRGEFFIREKIMEEYKNIFGKEMGDKNDY